MKEADSDDIDRLSIPVRLQSGPIMRKHWGKRLFMHWPVPAERLRPSIPRGIRSNTNCSASFRATRVDRSPLGGPIAAAAI